MNHLTQVKQATASLIPSEPHDLSARIAVLLAAEVATANNGSIRPLGGFPRRRMLPCGCWLDGKAIKGHAPYLYLRWRVGSRQRSKYLGKASAKGSKASAPVAAQRSIT